MPYSRNREYPLASTNSSTGTTFAGLVLVLDQETRVRKVQVSFEDRPARVLVITCPETGDFALCSRWNDARDSPESAQAIVIQDPSRVATANLPAVDFGVAGVGIFLPMDDSATVTGLRVQACAD